MMEQFLDGCTSYFGCCPLIFIQNWWEQNYFPCSHFLDPSSFETASFTSPPQLFLCLKSAHTCVSYLFTHTLVTFGCRPMPKIRNKNIKMGKWNDSRPVGQDVATICHVFKAQSVIMIKTLDLCEISTPNCSSTSLFFFFQTKRSHTLRNLWMPSCCTWRRCGPRWWQNARSRRVQLLTKYWADG